MQPDMLFIALFLIIVSLVIAAGFLTINLLADSSVERRIANQSANAPWKALPANLQPPARTAIGKFDRWLEQLIIEAGFDWEPEVVVLGSTAIGLLVGGGMFVWLDNALLGVAGLVAAMVAVLVAFLVCKFRRKRKVQEQLPHAVELIARGLRAGHSLEQAVEVVSETIAEPLASELRRCSGHLEMALSIELVMAGLTRRVPLAETRILAAALTIQRNTGGNLPTVLDRLARAWRDRLSYRRQYQATTATSRMSAMMITSSVGLAVLYMVIWQREYIQNFFEYQFGETLLGSAIVLQIVGIVWLLRLMRSGYNLS